MKKIFSLIVLLAITLSGVSQVSIKKSQDTCNQILRSVNSKLGSAITVTSTSGTDMKRGIDTVNQKLRQVKVLQDSALNFTKSKTVVLTFTSSNAGTLTVAGAVIMNNALSPQNFSISLGAGSWELVSSFAVNSGGLTTDLYFYSSSFSAGNDNSVTGATLTQLRTLLGYVQYRNLTGGQNQTSLYSTFVGGSSLIFNQSTIYCIPNYRSEVTPAANDVYTYVLNFKRRN